MSNPIKLRATVDSVHAQAEGVYLVRLKPVGRLPRFKSGQFLHLTVDEYDPSGGYWPESRVFSIASRSGGDAVAIVYSVKGAYTSKMERCLFPGAEVWLKLPYGDFVINANVRQGQDAVLIAGGTGLSPFVPYLEELASGGSAFGKVRLYYGTRLKSQILFADLIESCAASVNGFSARFTIEDGPAEVLDIQGTSAVQGRLSIEAIYRETKEFFDPVYFLSGPPSMIALFKQQLADKGVALDNIKIDEWE